MSTTRQPRNMGRREVHLSEVPVEVRVAEAQALIKANRLGPIDAILLAGAAELPIQNPSIEVAEWKVELVRRGKRVGGSVPKDLW